MATIRIKPTVGSYVNVEINQSTITLGALKGYNAATRAITWSGNAVFMYPGKLELSVDDAVIDLTQNGGEIRLLLTQKKMKAGASDARINGASRAQLLDYVRTYRTRTGDNSFLYGFTSLPNHELVEALNATRVLKVLFPVAAAAAAPAVDTSAIAEMRAITVQIADLNRQSQALADRFLTIYQTRFAGMTDADFEREAASLRA
jgi:hypothetical protein